MQLEDGARMLAEASQPMLRVFAEETAMQQGRANELKQRFAAQDAALRVAGKIVPKRARRV